MDGRGAFLYLNAQKYLYILDIRKNRIIKRFPLEMSEKGSLIVSPDGKKMAVLDGDQTFKLFNLEYVEGLFNDLERS